MVGARLPFSLKSVRKFLAVSELYTDQLLLLKPQNHHLSKGKVRHPRALQKLLPLAPGGIPDAEEKLLGVVLAALAHAVLDLEHLGAQVALAGADGEVLLAGVAAEARVPGRAARRGLSCWLLAAQTQRGPLLVQGLQIPFAQGGTSGISLPWRKG